METPPRPKRPQFTSGGRIHHFSSLTAARYIEALEAENAAIRAEYERFIQETPGFQEKLLDAVLTTAVSPIMATIPSSDPT